MTAVDIIGFLGIVALALVTGLIGGMRLGRWAARKDEQHMMIRRLGLNLR